MQHLTHRSSGRPKGRRLPQTLGSEYQCAQFGEHSEVRSVFVAVACLRQRQGQFCRSARCAQNTSRRRRRASSTATVRSARGHCAASPRTAVAVAPRVFARVQRQVAVGCPSFGGQRTVGCLSPPRKCKFGVVQFRARRANSWQCNSSVLQLSVRLRIKQRRRICAANANLTIRSSGRAYGTPLTSNVRCFECS